jgi:hypothetical protein
MVSEFGYHIDRIDNVLLRLWERGREFLDNEVTITNVVSLMNSDTLKVDFREKVVGKSR